MEETYTLSFCLQYLTTIVIGNFLFIQFARKCTSLIAFLVRRHAKLRKVRKKHMLCALRQLSAELILLSDHVE